MMDMEVNPVVRSDYLFNSNPFADPSEGDTNAMLAFSLGVPYDQTWDPTSLHRERNVAESEVQDVPDISVPAVHWELMDMETDPVVCYVYLFNSNHPLEGDTNAMLASSLGAPYDQTRDPTSLHPERNVAESQVQDVADTG
ncbi:hypothetical protein NL676_010214 [Syzygium grande]|nr:hypothetical protein NL676_010214 [Syzygium grande]